MALRMSKTNWIPSSRKYKLNSDNLDTLSCRLCVLKHPRRIQTTDADLISCHLLFALQFDLPSWGTFTYYRCQVWNGNRIWIRLS